MKNLHKILLFIIPIIFIFALTLTAYAATEKGISFTMEASASTVNAGETISVQIAIDENDGFYMAMPSVYFNNEAFELTNIEVTDSFNNCTISKTDPAKANENGIAKVTITGTDLTKCIYSEGNVATFTFKALGTYDGPAEFSFVLNKTDISDTLENRRTTKYVISTPEAISVNVIGNEHTWNKGEVALAPLCEEKGEMLYTCSVCGTTKTEVIDAIGHKFENYESDNNATCEADGTKSAVCENGCGKVDKIADEGSALGHDPEYVEAKDADCVNDGNYECYACSRCEKYFADEEAQNELDYETEVKIKKLGHDEIVDEAVDASCTETGLTEGLHCARCNEILVAQEETEKLGHDYDDGEVTVDPTCTEDGEITYTCLRCTDSYTEVLEKLGHDLNTEDAKDPTCTEKGWDAYEYCTRCEYTTCVEKDPLGHDYNDGEVISEPTCEKDGSKVFTCLRCTTIYTEAIEKLGHDYVYHEAQDPTCTEKGWKEYNTCSRCDYTEYEEISELGHNYIDKEAKDQSCTEDGWAAYVECTRCGYNTKSVIPASHILVKVNPKAPTCTEDGYFGYEICTRCEYESEKVEIEKLGHAFNTYKSNDDATCTEYGTKTAKCENCGIEDTVVDPAQAPKGHTPVTVAAVDATCTKTGLTAGKKCSVCDKILEDQNIVPMLAHDYESKVTAPTCTESGNTTYTCKVCRYSYVSDITAPVDHQYEATVVAPTCTTAGYTLNKCKACDNTYVSDNKDALGHNEIVDAAVAAKCAEAGLTEGKHCDRCGAVLAAQTTVPALGHKFGEYVSDGNASCTVIGTMTAVCSVCGTTDTKVGTGTGSGHNVEILPAVAPTCTEAGLTEGKVCKDCGAIIVSQTTVMPKGHDLDRIENRDFKEATKKEEGYTGDKYCLACGQLFEKGESIPKKNGCACSCKSSVLGTAALVTSVVALFGTAIASKKKH